MDYERPLVEPDNMLSGGFQSGRYDAAPSVDRGRFAARWGLAFAVLWLGGFGSLVAVPLGLVALTAGEIGRGHRRMAAAAVVVGLVGLVGSAALVLG